MNNFYNPYNNYSNNYFGASIALEKTKDCVERYPYPEKKKQFENYIAFTVLSYYMGFKSSFNAKNYIDSMCEMIEKPEIYTDLAKSQQISKEISALDSKVSAFNKAEKVIMDAGESFVSYT